MLSIWFQNLKSPSTWFNPCFPLRRAFLLLYVESVYLLPSILEANTCVNCALILTYLLICIHHITLCWQLSMRYTCWSWKQPLKLISSFVLLQCLYFEFIALWVTLMQVLLMLVLKVLFMKSLCYMIHLFNHHLYHCFESLHSSHMLYNNVDQDYVGSMSLKKLSLLSFTYSRASRN